MNKLSEHPQMQSLNHPSTALESYDHISLDELELEEALRAAREKKYFQLKREEYNRKLNEDMSPPTFTWEQLRDRYAEKYTIDQENAQVVTDLCYYFSGDLQFSGDLNRGLLLYGAVGVGKTSLMQVFFRNHRQSFVVVSCRQVESAFAQEGNQGLMKYFDHSRAFCFDDLGTEPAVTKYYGTDKAAMTEVLLNRYDFRMPYNCTHITTNLSAEEIKQRYGTRVVDRMREMFNFIEFKTTKSRRS